jgi:signal transduction histidine kinase
VAEKLLKLKTEEVKGKRLDEIEPLNGMLLLSLPEEGWPPGGSDEERVVMTRQGDRLVVTSRMAHLGDAQGRPAGRIEILTDLTETDRLRREVHRLDTLAAMGEMAAAVAHQIRNPLNGVEGFASLLQRTLAREEENREGALRFAGHIVQGVRQVNAIINGMLMLSKPDALHPSRLCLNDLLQEVLAELKTTAKDLGIDARIELRHPGAALWILADGLKLKQALLNIGNNALSALKAPGRGGLRMTLDKKGGWIRIRVADSGAGMTPEVATKVFRPFFTTREDGVGLGLSVATKIVDFHGGGLSVRSLLGRGTVFKMVFNSRASQMRCKEPEEVFPHDG